jgi:hypothetical protein
LLKLATLLSFGASLHDKKSLMKQTKLFFLVLLLSAQFLYGQDRILKQNNEIVNCLILNIEEDAVKYKFPGHPADSIFSISKEAVAKVVFENGVELVFDENKSEVQGIVVAKNGAIKMEFLSPLSGNTTFAYERKLQRGRSIEGTIGIIGLGVYAPKPNAGGLLLKAGYKFIFIPDQFQHGLQYTQPLRGSYLKPEIMIGFYAANMEYYYDHYVTEYGYSYYTSSTKSRHTSVFSAALQLVMGKQWIIDNTLMLDVYAGVGYGFAAFSPYNKNYDFTNEQYHYGYTIGSEIPVSFSAGFKLGLPMK